MIIQVQFSFQGGGVHKLPYTLDIDASHAYRDAKGRLVTPSHHRQVAHPMPKSITEGLKAGISQLDWLLRARHNPFAVADEGEPEERAFRLVG